MGLWAGLKLQLAVFQDSRKKLEKSP